MVKMIVAVDNKWGIAKKGLIPWNCKRDMKFFKDITLGTGNNAVVMGHKTFETLKRPLTGRFNYVLTHQTNPPMMDVAFIQDIDNLPSTFDDIWVIGGAMVYSLALKAKLPQQVYITRIPGNFACDQHFNKALLEEGYKLLSHLTFDELEVELWVVKS